MDRWKAATARLWRAEPALALCLYVLLALAQLAYMHLAGWGFRHGNGLSVDHFTVAAVRSSAAIVPVAAFLAWRIWVGGAVFWTIAVLWALLGTVATAVAGVRTGSPFVIGLMPFDLAGLTLLFMPSVLERVAHPEALDALRAARRSERRGQRAPASQLLTDVRSKR